jgi:serine/threonine protein kinase
MSSRVLTCTCGHSWQHTAAGPLPEDLSEICPLCLAAGPTLDHTSSTDSPGKLRPQESRARPGSTHVLPGFEILEEINRGGMGIIYKARQTGLNRLVALKVISPERVGSADAMRRFRREVQAAALLSHPNIVTVFHTDLDGPLPYLAMEYVPGIDLHKLVRQVGPLAAEDACYYIHQAAHGLQHAFEQGLVHRDIKPANLMVTPSPLEKLTASSSRMPKIKILDMGLARVTLPSAASEATSGLTQAGEFLGTPDYIAPEQAEDSRKADSRSDLYSLGGTLYFLLTAEVPFPGGNLIQKLRRQLMEPPPSVAARRPDVPAEVDAVLRRLMARVPADRFQTPVELIAALEGFLRRPPRGPQPALCEAPVPLAVRSAAPTPVPAVPDKAPSTHFPVRQTKAHEGGVQALALSADGRLLLTGGYDETLAVWEAEQLREVRRIASTAGPVQEVGLAPNAKWAASCALRLFQPDMVVQLWDLGSGSERRRLKGHTDNLHCLAIAPDGRRVAAGSADQAVRIWALDQKGSPSIALEGHSGTVTSVKFLPGGELLLSGSADGTIRLWESRTGAPKGTISAGVGKITAVAFGGASKRIAMAGAGLRIRQPQGAFTDLRGHQGTVLCLAFSADGSWLLSGGSDGTVRLWRADTGEEMKRFNGHGDRVRAVAISPDLRVAFSGSADGTLRRWRLPL